MIDTTFEVMNPSVYLGSDGEEVRCRLDLVELSSTFRLPSGKVCTLKMLREDAERLLDQLQRVLYPTAPSTI